MPVFPSQEWCEAVIDAMNSDPDFPQAGQGWDGDLAAAVLPERPFLKEGFAIHARPTPKGIKDFRVLEDLDEIEEIEPAYVARADYSTWKNLIQGTLDPIEAVLKRRIQFEGDLEPIIARAQFKHVLTRAMARVETLFIDAARS